MAGIKAPVPALTSRHVVYLIFMHCLGASILSGAINFGLATAMYKNTKDAVHIWGPLSNTLAGDLGVTIILQQLITWTLDRLAVGGDLKKGLVAPLRMPKNASGLIRWFVGLDHVRSYDTLGAKIGYYLNFHGKRIAVIILATFVLYWPISIGILIGLRNAGIGRDKSDLEGDFNIWPFPSILKGVYGAALGLSTPFMSYITLIYRGETMSKQDLTELSSSTGNSQEGALADETS